MSYCYLDDVKVHSRITFTQLGMLTGDYDAWISGTLIPKAKELIDSYVGHDFELTNGTIILDGSGKEVLHINRRGLVNPVTVAGIVYGLRPPHLLPVPLIDINRVEIDSVNRTPLGDFKPYDTFIAYDNNCFDCGRQNVEIWAIWGYGTYPQDIRDVAMSICTNIIRGQLKRYLAPDILTKAIMKGGGLTAFYAEDTELTPELKSVLDRYRFPEVG